MNQQFIFIIYFLMSYSPDSKQAKINIEGLEETEQQINLTRKSSKKDFYQQFLANQTKATHMQLNELHKDDIQFNQKPNFWIMKIEIVNQTINSQAVMLKVSWGYFISYISILNIQGQSHNHKCSSISVGGFGDILIDHKNHNKAIKCLKYKSGKLKNRVKLSAIKEYFLAKVASSLKVGPYISSKQSFDLIFYDECIEFRMQLCKIGRMDPQFFIKSMKQNLLTLHHYNFIHFDIKPQNIMFSPYFGKPVFIDFGLSSLIKQKMGEMSHIHYKGSIDYCCQQMKMAFYSESKQWVDVYYNDAYSLKKSLSEFSFTLKKIEQQILQQEYSQQKIKHNIQEIQLLIKIKYYLFLNNKMQLRSLLTQRHKYISNNSLEKVIQFLQVLQQPTLQIIEVYNQMQTQVKKDIRFYKINKILSKNCFLDTQIYRQYGLYHQKHLIYQNSFFQSLNDVSWENNNICKLTKQKMIELLTKDNQLSKNKQKYFLVLIRLINFTSNLFEANLQERVKVVDYCLQNILNIHILEEQAPQSRISTCIIQILEWFCNKPLKEISGKQKQIENITLFSLIEHLFILGRADPKRITDLLGRIQEKYYKNISQRIYFLLKIRIFMMWTVERYEKQSLFHLVSSIQELLNWCYQSFSHIKLYAQEKYKPIITFIKFLLPMTANKNRFLFKKEILLEQLLVFSEDINKEIQLHYIITTFHYIDDLNQIGKIIKIQQNSRLFSWTFTIYWYCFNFLNIESRRKIYKIFEYNLKNTEIISQFVISDIEKLCLITKENKLYRQQVQALICRITYANILFQPKFFQILLHDYQLLITSIKNNIQSKKQHQKLAIKAIQLREWPYINQKLSNNNHICFDLEFIHIILYVRLYSYLKQDNRVQNQRQIDNLKAIQNHLQCKYCKNSLQIFIQTNSFSFSITQKELSQEYFINKYLHIESLINQYNPSMTQLQSTYFKITNYYLFALFCTRSKQTEQKYGGIKGLYFHLKGQQKLYQYVNNSNIKRILFVTFQVIYRICIEQFYYFLDQLSFYVNACYSQYHFSFLRQQKDNFVNQIGGFDYVELLNNIERIERPQKQHQLMFYYSILFDFASKSHYAVYTQNTMSFPASFKKN